MNKIKKRVKLILEGKNFKDKLKIFISVITLGRYKPKAYLKNKDGLFFVRKNSSDLWMLSTCGEQELRKYFQINNGSFIDVGANVGKYSIMLGNKFKNYEKIISIEPEKETFNALLKNIKLNNIKRILPLNYACFSKNKILKFYVSNNNSGAHSMYKKTKKEIFVRGIRLDEIVYKYKIKKIDLIKVDVEGAEFDVFLGAIKTLKRDHPKVIFESWNKDNLLKVKKILLPLKYNITKLSSQDYFAE